MSGSPPSGADGLCAQIGVGTAERSTEGGRMVGSVGPERQGLYDPRNEHDACGVGFVAHIKNKKSHAIVADGIRILANLAHRGAVSADPLAGDGAGLLVQIPDKLFRAEAKRLGFALPKPGHYGIGM